MQPEQANPVTPAAAPDQPAEVSPQASPVNAPPSVAPAPAQTKPEANSASTEHQAPAAATTKKSASKQPSGVNVPVIVAIVICVVLIATTVVAIASTITAISHNFMASIAIITIITIIIPLYCFYLLQGLCRNTSTLQCAVVSLATHFTTSVHFDTTCYHRLHLSIVRPNRYCSRAIQFLRAGDSPIQLLSTHGNEKKFWMLLWAGQSLPVNFKKFTGAGQDIYNWKLYPLSFPGSN